MIESIKAEIEMMKAENDFRERRGEAQAYGENAFADCSRRLENLAANIDFTPFNQ